MHGLEAVTVPMGPEGMSLEVLEKAFGRCRPRLVYTIPSFHNPTGITTGQAHRERLLALCESHRVPIVEDGFEEEMKYFGRAVLPIKSMDRAGIVLYVGTFSKVVFPGLRVGWIAAARECAEHLAAIQRVSCLAGNTLAQAAAARFCRSGLYEAHLRRAHKVYRRRMQAMLRCLIRYMPNGVEWTRPAGGYTLWLRIPPGRADEASVADRVLKEGVRLSPGRLYFDAAPPQPSFRLSIACVAESEIEEGCRRLGRALKDVLGS
jgi:DNA-binding transcriptional MocR family regulator